MSSELSRKPAEDQSRTGHGDSLPVHRHGDSPGGIPAGRGGALRRHRFERGHVPLRRALGPENVLAVTMPYKTSSEATRRDSQAVIERLGVRTVDVPIADQIDAYFARFPDASQLRLANKCARERMTVLYDQSAAFGGPGGGHEQQERVAVGLWHAVRRHGLGHQPDRRPLQDATLPLGRAPRRARANPGERADRRSVGRADRRGRAGFLLRRGRSAVGAVGRSPLAAGGTVAGRLSRPSSSIA